ncbi:hypothetical protein ACFL41_02015 [Gemmatimonadota bacterium]
MNDQTREPDDLTRLVRSITSGEPEEGVDRVMEESLQDFRERLTTHPYVRRLERKGRISSPGIWFVAGRPVAVRWAAAALSVLIMVVAGLSLRQQEIVPVAWAEVADQVAGIDRMMISMRVTVGQGTEEAGKRLQGVPAEAEVGVSDLNETPADARIAQQGEVKDPPPAAARAVRSDEVQQQEARTRGAGGGRGAQVAEETAPSLSRREAAPQKPVIEPAAEAEGLEARDADMDFYLSKEGGFRWDVLLDSEPVSSLFIPPAGDSMLWLMHEQAAWLDMPVDRDQASRTVPAVEQDPAEYIRRFVAAGYRELGESIIEGVEVTGIEVDDPPAGDEGVLEGVGRLWIHPLSRLPVRLELIGEVAGDEVRWVFDFRWGEQVDPEAFVPKIPPGYTPPPWIP